MDDMAPHGARASTSTVRIKLTCIEETFQCLPEHIISVFGDHHMKQIVKEPTREENILDL